ncbi:hypothetical protein [Noviherbaspirillum pedocola]|uniref:Lipoprotein n=1 Tax=Noviherbaspirillum pedocola TaxID=2801341 RepID=A0A934W8Q2_9BURK|nr:hypothetical protein [Noviherbaspirillum pedocola]MBK4737845.1 hypothetical protein [Noviherbaspirillum pedocola]
MKTALLLLATLALAACSTFGNPQGSASAQSQADKPHSLRTFDANDPYHGG